MLTIFKGFVMLKDEKGIGVLNCFAAKPHEFSETEVNLITAVANQAAVPS